MSKNIGGARNTNLEKDGGSVMRQKITESGPVPNQDTEEVPIHQARDTESISPII